MPIEKTKCDFCGDEFEFGTNPWIKNPTTCKVCEDNLAREKRESIHRNWIKGLSLEQRIEKIERWILDEKYKTVNNATRRML
jgi:hypothetical protein